MGNGGTADDKAGQRLSDGDEAKIEAAIGYCATAIELHEATLEFCAGTIERLRADLAALSEVKAAGRISAANRARLEAAVDAWKKGTGKAALARAFGLVDTSVLN